jgi:hypothetical protein
VNPSNWIFSASGTYRVKKMNLFHEDIHKMLEKGLTLSQRCVCGREVTGRRNNHEKICSVFTLFKVAQSVIKPNSLQNANLACFASS